MGEWRVGAWLEDGSGRGRARGKNSMKRGGGEEFVLCICLCAVHTYVFMHVFMRVYTDVLRSSRDEHSLCAKLCCARHVTSAACVPCLRLRLCLCLCLYCAYKYAFMHVCMRVYTNVLRSSRDERSL